MSAYTGKWERRWHPLREEWVVYSAHRNTRPWQGAHKLSHVRNAHDYDPACYLCPGNVRVHGAQNQLYTDVFVFDNDHPVVGMEAPPIDTGEGIFKKASAKGTAKVICYDPRHNITLSQMSAEKVAKVFACFQEETFRLSQTPGIDSIFIF